MRFPRTLRILLLALGLGGVLLWCWKRPSPPSGAARAPGGVARVSHDEPASVRFEGDPTTARNAEGPASARPEPPSQAKVVRVVGRLVDLAGEALPEADITFFGANGLARSAVISGTHYAVDGLPPGRTGVLVRGADLVRTERVLELVESESEHELDLVIAKGRSVRVYARTPEGKPYSSDMRLSAGSGAFGSSVVLAPRALSGALPSWLAHENVTLVSAPALRRPRDRAENPRYRATGGNVRQLSGVGVDLLENAAEMLLPNNEGDAGFEMRKRGQAGADVIQQMRKQVETRLLAAADDADAGFLGEILIQSPLPVHVLWILDALVIADAEIREGMERLDFEVPLETCLVHAGSARVQVCDAVTGLPCPRAIVRLSGEKHGPNLTSSDGSILFRHVRPGWQLLEVLDSASGVSGAGSEAEEEALPAAEFWIQPAVVTDLGIVRIRGRGRVAGCLRDPKGAPADTRLALVPRERWSETPWPSTPWGSISKEGQFEFRSLPRGEYVLLSTGSEWLIDPQSIDLRAGTTPSIEFGGVADATSAITLHEPLPCVFHLPPTTPWGARFEIAGRGNVPWHADVFHGETFVRVALLPGEHAVTLTDGESVMRSCKVLLENAGRFVDLER